METNEKTGNNEGMPVVMPSEGFVRLPVVIAVLGIGKTTFRRGIREGRFPKPVKIGPRSSAWRVEDIRATIAEISKQFEVFPG